MRFILLAAALTLSQLATAQPPARTPVLVELFTSEGCSSCPPADALLSRLAHSQPIDNAQIIVLGEHVDYWDQLGWHDRFSSAQYTARQNHYSTGFHLDSIYTPQMVVDGSSQFVGNDQTQAWRAVASAARTTKLPLAVSAPVVNGRAITASVTLAATSAPEADLYAALVDPYDTTEVHRGENSGRRLQHVGVVRTLTRIGTTRDLGHKPFTFTLSAPENAIPATMQVVVFAQQSTANTTLGPILGAAISTLNSSEVSAAR